MRLWERLERVRESQGWSGREFARRAGLAYEQHYGTLIKRLMSEKSTRTSSETIEALSKAAVALGFSRKWLIEGKGPERDARATSRPPAESFTPPPGSSLRAIPVAPRLEGQSNRERAAVLLEDAGFSAEDARARLSLGAIVAGIPPDSDPSIDVWLDAAHRADWARRQG